jgi:2-polyprenyl-6-methoxyphenol hydroxylase-like FAD-dependent oxidoreductase
VSAVERTTCLIIGGGPAGMMLGLLLARGGVEVMVLEKHGDFLRDFRGDTVHASTVRLMDELGLGPHSEICRRVGSATWWHQLRMVSSWRSAHSTRSNLRTTTSL